MDIIGFLSVGKSLVEIGQEISKRIESAQKSTDVTKRVLIYLESVQIAVNALGIERQQILADVRKCDLENVDQLNKIWERIDRYLHVDDIRPKLISSIEGLSMCSKTIQKESHATWWRKNDKDDAVKSFVEVLNKLKSLIEDLSSNFYPWGSGMGVQTLVPIYEVISKIRNESKSKKLDESDFNYFFEEIGDLSIQALRDSSHEEWFRISSKVESLITELQLAFSIKILEESSH